MKRCIAVFVAVILMMTLTACGQDRNREIDKRYRNLESYTARMQVTVTGNKDESVYELVQTFLAPENYRTEVLSPKELQGTVSITNGDQMYFVGGDAPAVSLTQNRTDGADCLSVADFFRSYFDRGQMEERDGKVLLHVLTENENSWRTSQRMELDAKTLLPETLLVFDRNDNEVLRIEFIDFVPNKTIEKNVFTP